VLFLTKLFFFTIIDTAIDVTESVVLFDQRFMEKDVQAQIAELEAKIQTLRSQQTSELQQKLKDARHLVADLEQQIAAITGKAPAPAVAETRRKRTSSEEVRNRITTSLANAPHGLSQKDISDQTGLNYNTVVLYLKNHARDFKTTGSLRSKRYFLK
jgi:septal ring factor EnvC (AmiA/AmiB activator)